MSTPQSRLCAPASAAALVMSDLRRHQVRRT
jgi:hypothetical protein